MKPLILFILFLCISINNAYAYDCIMRPLENYMEEAEIVIEVFALEVFDTISGQDSVFYQSIASKPFSSVQVTSVFKGNIAVNQKLSFVPKDDSNCSFRFTKGEHYILFAYKVDEHYIIYSCSYSDYLPAAKKVKRKIKRWLKRRKT